MNLPTSTGERLRRATQLWHVYLAATGKRFELAQFLKDGALEKQVLATALASKDAKLVKLAHAWLGDSAQPLPIVPAPAATGEAPKPGRYLRGVR